MPRKFDEQAWAKWARVTLDGWRMDRKLRVLEHGCIQTLKDEGEIR